MTEVIQTDASSVVFFLQAVALPAASSGGDELMATVEFFGAEQKKFRLAHSQLQPVSAE